jgi:hypothetical protein
MVSSNEIKNALTLGNYKWYWKKIIINIKWLIIKIKNDTPPTSTFSKG